MSSRSIISLVAIGLLSVCPIAFADLADTLENYAGYTIAATKHIAGYIDEDGKKSDGFEGCEFGRKSNF